MSSPAIEAAWPAWWSDDAAQSSAARAELRFTLARRLGLSPKGLSGDRVEFVWRDNARFKHLSKGDGAQQAALTSFGMAVARSLILATPPTRSLEGLAASRLRQIILKDRQFVDLAGLLATAWAVGVPVIHLRVFPLSTKGMHAMVVNVDGRYAILLGRDAEYPAPISFTLAHEIGHIALRHLKSGDAVVDMPDEEGSDEGDDEETQADSFALELLTGDVSPDIQTNIDDFGAQQLAAAVLSVGPERRIEPGTLALCLAHRNKNWAVANAALKQIYVEAKPVWQEVNGFAQEQIDWSALTADANDYLRALMAVSNGT